MKYWTLIPAAVAGVLTFVVNQLAHIYGWYQALPFFDKWMHVLGGVFAFLLIAAYRRRATALQLLIMALLVGLLWEGYEHFIDVLFKTDLIHIPDSIGDLIADMVGAVVACAVLFFVQSTKKRYNTINAN